MFIKHESNSVKLAGKKISEECFKVFFQQGRFRIALGKQASLSKQRPLLQKILAIKENNLVDSITSRCPGNEPALLQRPNSRQRSTLYNGHAFVFGVYLVNLIVYEGLSLKGTGGGY